ncbi:hypothetical protein LTR36_007174 [Oleoguttula mirabilis]|uniref:UBC core domain-containing protein n=1 Tax=Oleoguttula mirabilis TaxID=1507867 RepID=A0AAV9JAD4_9PEZI|nr:hypothetical protein LTR36_007174 [Oleoguttula mirabilis]
MDRPLHTDDVVAKKGNENQLGVIERTHADVDTHEPYPEREEDDPIRHDREISQAAFRKFHRDGVPPQGTVLVRWEGKDSAQLIPEAKLELVDRELLVGDVVKKDVRDAMSGVVINAFAKCTLQPVCDVKYRDNHIVKGLLGPQPSPGIRYTATGRPPLVVDVPAAELMYAESPDDESLIIYKDWLGRVEAVNSNIALLLADGCVVEISDEFADHADDEPDAFVVGDVAMTKKGHLRTGRWIFGQYTPNTPPIGTVVQVRTLAVEVSWLQRRIGCSSDVEPPAVLEREELESGQFHIYDRTKRPSRPFGTTTTPDTSTISNSEIDVQLSLRVRFKDLAGACVKYDGSTSHGRLPRIDRQSTRGYDINVFDVVRFHTDVIVQWQDLSVTAERTIDLVPDVSIDDEHAAWPGEIVHTLDMTKLPGMTTVEQPSKVGVVQSVNATERMAKIKWAPEAVIHYSVDIGEDAGPKVLLTGAVGSATDEEEEVSLYDLEAPAAMNVRRGDIVLIANKTWTADGGAPGSEDPEWLGEIVDTCLDGTLTVRLGAATTVRDVSVRREDVVVAIRSDGTGEIDGWEGEDGLDDMVDGPELAQDGSGDLGVWHGQAGSDDDEEPDDYDMDDEDDDEEPEAKYEDENGQPMDEDEVENEDWESEDEDDEMPDHAPQQTPPTSHSATPPDAEQARDAVDSSHAPPDPSVAEPDQYAVLSDAVPARHRYSAEPFVENVVHMKRVQKEHKILQKPGAIPNGVYVRTWESRLDLIRVLFIGPTDTPYQDAPFVIDFYLPPQFPSEPPQAYFHSWAAERGLGGVGRVNPNLYEDGKICLSLLGTWEGNKGEGWNASRSTLLQVIVSLLGLVLVKEPYFNEAGYEPLAGLESSRRPSALYSEATFLRARTFVITALSRLQDPAASARDLEGLEEVVRWLYWASSGPRLVDKVVKDLEEVLGRSEAGGVEADGLTVMSKGACIPLRRVLERLRQLL